MKNHERTKEELYILCSEDVHGSIWCYAWSKQEVPKKTIKKMVRRHREDVSYFCLPWWRVYPTKREARKLPKV